MTVSASATEHAVRLAVVVVLAMSGGVLAACSSQSSDTARPTTASAGEPTTTTRLEVTVPADVCGGRVAAAISSINLAAIDPSDGLSQSEIDDLSSQIEVLEERIPDLTSEGRCATYISDPIFLDAAIAFLPTINVTALDALPGIEARGLWGPVVAHYKAQFGP